jgi:hypothetical protein
MSGKRTIQQIAADRLDLQAARLLDSLHDFADKYKSPEVKEIAFQIAAGRYHIRQHMHIEDREATS